MNNLLLIPIVRQSSISDNSASYGGGIASDGSYGFYVAVQIGNGTFGSNSASVASGGIYLVGQGSQNVIVSLTNTILLLAPRAVTSSTTQGRSHRSDPISAMRLFDGCA